jgi:hypothetical protein
MFVKLTPLIPEPRVNRKAFYKPEDGGRVCYDQNTL